MNAIKLAGSILVATPIGWAMIAIAVIAMARTYAG